MRCLLSQTVYEVYPSGSRGAMTYDKVFIYRQGVAFHFRTTGLFFKFDAEYVVVVLISGMVLLAAAKFVATQVAMNLMPGVSKMIQNRTREVFDVNARFAEIGMKAALASLQFHLLDADGDGVLDVEDLVTTYATLHDVTAEEAIAVSKLVLAAADQETDALGRPKRKRRRKIRSSSSSSSATVAVAADGAPAAASPPQGVDFSEFLVAREGGQMIGFRKYLDLVTKASRNVQHIGEDGGHAACHTRVLCRRAGASARTRLPDACPPDARPNLFTRFFRGNAGGEDVDEEKRVAAWTALFEQKHEEAMHGAKERAAAAAKLAAGVTVTRH